VGRGGGEESYHLIYGVGGGQAAAQGCRRVLYTRLSTYQLQQGRDSCVI
jgi:hypothetical protein